MRPSLASGCAAPSAGATSDPEASAQAVVSAAPETIFYVGTSETTSPDGAIPFGPPVVVAVTRTVDPSRGTITEFVEKPSAPPSTLIGIALYYYPAATVRMIAQYLAEGNNPDQPGRFVQWLYPRTPVQTWSVPGTWFDVGSKETLEEAGRIFAKFAK